MKTPLFYYNYMIPLVLAAIFSLRAFRLKWPQHLRYFSLYLWASVITESLAILWKDLLYLHHTRLWHYSKYNGWIYNLYFIPLYVFYGLFFNSILPSAQLRVTVRVVTGAFAAFALYNILFLQGMQTINTFTIVSGCSLVIFFSGCYWVSLITSSELPALTRQPEFWIVAGAFLCHLGIFTYYISTYSMNAAQMKEWLAVLSLVVWSNTIMYSSYLTAFLCTRNYYR
jgi:hypothetical protein